MNRVIQTLYDRLARRAAQRSTAAQADAPPPAALTVAATDEGLADLPDWTAPGRERLRECPECGLFQHVPALPRGASARCARCDSVLRHRRTDPMGRALALALAGVVLFAMATRMTFIDLSLRGLARASTLFTGPVELEQHGMWEIAIAVLVTTVAAPALKLLATIWVLLGLRLENPPRSLHVVFRWVEWLSPWAMTEVFLLGVFVAYTKLIELAHVEVGGAVYALGALTLTMAATDAMLDREAVWDRLEQRGDMAEASWTDALQPAEPGRLIGCNCCNIVVPVRPFCPRCGSVLRDRKPQSIARTWALMSAAAVLYVPANVLPVMTVISLGRGRPETILSGVQELAASGMWPLALLVFFASITVPVAKLITLVVLLVSTARGSAVRLRERTVLYRIVDAVGRWSMIDVFMISILTALVRMGTLASVYPGPGVISFCSVVLLTMVAAMCFDPRLMWDAAIARGYRPVTEGVQA